VKKTIFSIATLSLSTATACGQHDEDIDPPAEAVTRSDTTDAVPTQVYYSVRPDFRKCVFPLCGGWYLGAVNTNETTCADGSVVDSTDGCYVSEIDFNGLELGEGDLLHGEFVKKDYGQMGTFDTLSIDALYSPIFDQKHESYFRYNLLRPNNIVCFTEPCPSTDVAKLNTPYYWQDPFTFDEVDAYGGDEDEALAAFFSEYEAGGAIVDSHWHSPWWTGDGWELSVTNVFVRKLPMCLTVRHSSNDSVVAWNVSSVAQAQEIIGDPENWLWTDISEGSCGDMASETVCTEEYAPLCGSIDATGVTETFSNECELVQAVRKAANESGKATGESTQGECEGGEGCHLDDPAYSYVGDSPEQCAVIQFICEANASYFADDCGCGCVDASEPTVEPAGPGELCGGFVNLPCVEGLSCEGLGDNGSTVGTCTCPEWLNCFPGPDTEPCDLTLLEICPDTQVAW
jgi:hypothetical protein